MPDITFVNAKDSVDTVKASVGKSVKDAAMENGVDGIIAECGGNAMCATCHVYVDNSYLEKLPEMQDDEDELLEGVASPRRENSRLSCQIPMTEHLNGLVVRIPAEQH